MNQLMRLARGLLARGGKNGNAGRAGRRQARPGIEGLECRELLAASLTASLSPQGLLRVEGTAAPDLISVRQDGGRVSVAGAVIHTAGGAVRQVAAAQVKHVVVDGQAGIDVVRFDRGTQRVAVPAVVVCTAGDQVFGGAGAVKPVVATGAVTLTRGASGLVSALQATAALVPAPTPSAANAAATAPRAAAAYAYARVYYEYQRDHGSFKAWSSRRFSSYEQALQAAQSDSRSGMKVTAIGQFTDGQLTRTWNFNGGSTSAARETYAVAIYHWNGRQWVYGGYRQFDDYGRATRDARGWIDERRQYRAYVIYRWNANQRKWTQVTWGWNVK